MDQPERPENELADFRDAADRSQSAGIADESAGYVNAAAKADETLLDQGSDGIPQTGEEDPLAGVSDDGTSAAAGAESERQAGDSIEPAHMPGTAEEIEVAGVTGPGPSG